MKTIENQTKFNRLTYVCEDLHKRSKTNRNRRCIFRCLCGITKSIVFNDVLSGKTKSCGCYNTELIKIRNTVHGMSHKSEYHAYINAKNRCININNIGYKNYGGRGIQFKFNSFEEFFKHIKEKITDKHTLDRINNDGHYEIGNVKWSTRSEQQFNRRQRVKKIIITKK